MSEVEDPFRSIAYSHAVLGVSARSVMREIERGKLKAHKFGGLVRIRQSELDAYIERSRRGDPAPVEADPVTRSRRRSHRTRPKVAA